VLVSSFDHAALRVLRDHAPGLPLAPLWHRLPADWRETVRALDAGAVHLGARWASAEIVAAIAGHGLDVRLFTVNDPDAAAPMRAAGLTGLFTDHVPRVLAAPGWAAWARTPRG
jgi:glycerophosphoryl diester phosphodiesterase